MNDEIIEHPAFTGLPDETAVWRYLDDFKFRWLVNERRLWMTRVPDLRDKLEGTIPFGELEWWDAKAREAETAEQRSIFLHNRDFYRRYVRDARENWFASCWTIRDAEETRMWTEYTSSPRSIAVRSTFGSLKAALPTFVNVGTVNYLDYGSERIEGLNTYHRVMSKHKPDFGWEQELRVLVDLIGPEDAPWVKEARACHFEMQGNPALRIVAPPIDLSLLFGGIISHPFAPLDYRQELEQFCGVANIPSPQASSLSPPS